MTQKEHTDLEASFEDTDLEELTTRLKRVLDIRDRKYGFPSKTYPKCFVGSEAVARLVKEGIAIDEEDAVRIGNIIAVSGTGPIGADGNTVEGGIEEQTRRCWEISLAALEELGAD